MLARLNTILAATLLLFCTHAFAGTPLIVTDEGLNGVAASKYIRHYIEPIHTPLDRSLKILSKLDEFTPLPAEPRLGNKDTPIWFTMEIQNQSSEDSEVFLELPRQYFWQINLFIIRVSGVIEEESRGLESKLDNLEFPTTKSGFRIHLAHNERVRLMFYSLTNGPIDLTANVYSTLSYVKSEYQANLLNGIFYGIMIGLILYNAFLFLVLSDFAYLFYVLWGISLTLFFSTLNSVGVTYLWPGAGSWNRIFIFMFVGLFLTFEVMSLSAFLTNLDSRHERFLKKAALAVGLFTTVLSLMDPLWNYAGKAAATNLMALCAVIVMLVLLYLSYRSSQKGFRPAKILVIAYVPFAIVTVLRGLAQVGWASPIFHQNFIHQMSASVEMIFMSIALADRINYMTKLHRQSAMENEAIKIKNIQLTELEKLKDRENEAIIKTTQMLAHDVRKPFSILRMGLTMLGNARDPEKIKSLLAKLVPEVDRNLNSVDGLIADVMEIGSPSSNLIKEPVSAESLIENTVFDIFRVFPRTQVNIEYDFRHSLMPFVDAQRVGRAFSNIYGNAVQAMGYAGNTWFKTRDVVLSGKSYIEFCIGNSGSYIASDSLPKIFEAFFTSGKKGGTGLGLAIAQKVVAGHGGTIRCESAKNAEYPEGFVEFFFTLPASQMPRDAVVKALPVSSAIITAGFLGSPTQVEEDALASDRFHAASELEREIIEASRKLGRSLQILIVDDEDVYRQALEAAFKRDADLAKYVEVLLANGSEQAAAIVERQRFDLIISDVDMGKESLDGFELVRQIRDRLNALNQGCLICVHSNRIVAQDHKTALDCGADAFLSKPASRSQLLKLLLQAATNLMSEDTADIAEHIGGGTTSREIIVVDDNPFILDSWVDNLKGEVITHSASSPEELLHLLKVDPQLLSRLSCVILDQNFDNSQENGIGLGRLLKEMRPSLPVFLSSDSTFSKEELSGSIDRAISKKPVGLEALGIS